MFKLQGLAGKKNANADFIISEKQKMREAPEFITGVPNALMDNYETKA